MRARRAEVRSLLAALGVVALAVAACSSDAAAPARSTPKAGADGEALFRALEGDLVATCGGANGMCHVNGTYAQAPPWLGGADRYVTIKKYRGVLPATKEIGDSILLTQIAHEGPTLADAPNDLFGRVSDWITAEVPGPPLPNTGPFTVQTGFNSIPLDTVASGLTNARISFLANETDGTLTLTALRISAPNTASVTLDSPFFVALPRSGKIKADPDANGFKGQLDVAAGATADLYDGKMVLVRWDPTGRLKIAFDKIVSTPGQAAKTGCTALAVFTSKALPAMGMPVDVLPYEGQDPGPDPLGQSSCLGCHGKPPDPGQAPGPAVQAMDLRGAAEDPATACERAKFWVNVTSKSESVILLNPTGNANKVHPMKPVAADDPIVLGIKAWVDAEN